MPKYDSTTCETALDESVQFCTVLLNEMGDKCPDYYARKLRFMTSLNVPRLWPLVTSSDDFIRKAARELVAMLDALIEEAELVRDRIFDAEDAEEFYPAPEEL